MGPCKIEARAGAGARSRPGIYFINTYKPQERYRYSAEATAFHGSRDEPYTSEVDLLGVVSAEAWRAARLVVDTGIHALG